jgi:hypothetical protein
MKDKKPAKCKTRRCSNKASAGGLCSGCLSARYRKKYPIKAAYYILKENAKRRGKVFELSFEEFEQFAIKTDYIKKKGITAQSFHIDRKEETGGYTAGNLQLLTNSQNVKKYLKYAYDEHNRKMMFTTEVIKSPGEIKDVPF